MRVLYNQIKNSIFLITYILLSTQSDAQYTIKGRISDKSSSLDFVTISLTQSKVIVASNFSEANGMYILKVNTAGIYTISFSRIGYKKKDTTLIINSNIEINQILIEDIKQLDNIIISSALPEIKRRVDGYSFEIEKTFLATGNNVNTILPLLPGVITDGAGNISLNNSSVLIMIDNQEIKLPATQLGLYLNNIRSENIKLIEIISNPSAAYDAEGIGGIIKIITKKKIDNSYNGSVTIKSMEGIYPKNELSSNVMISHNKILMYAGGSGNVNNNFIKIENIRENSQTNILQQNIIDIKNRTLGYSFNGGIRYKINTNNSLTFDLDYGGTNMDIRNKEANMDMSLSYNKILDTIINSYTPLNAKSKTLSLSSNYQWDTDTLGSNLKITGDFLMPISHSYNGFYNAYFTNNKTFIDSLINDNNIDKTFQIFSLKIDRHKILSFQKIKMDYGGKFAGANTSVDNIYRNYNVCWTTDTNFTNSLQYNENIYAAYISVEKEIKRVQIVGGTRIEYTNYEITATANKKNNYINIFPNLSLLIPLNKKNTTFWGLHYNKRINRPSYEILNPFVYKMDEYSLKEGNPYLKPGINNKISTDIFFKRNYSILFSYEMEENTFGEVQKSLGSMTLQTFDNLSRKNEFNITANANLMILKKWIMVWQAMLYDRKFISPDYTANNIGVLIANVNIIRFTPSFDARLTTQFVTKGPDKFSIINKNFLFSSLDINKTLNKSGFQLKFGVNDIFNTRGNMSISYDYLSQNNNMLVKRDSRYIYISLVYSFKKGKSFKKPEYQKSNMDEEQRTK